MNDHLAVAASSHHATLSSTTESSAVATASSSTTYSQAASSVAFAALAASSPHAAKIAAINEVLTENQRYQSFLTSQLKEISLLLAVNQEKRRLVEQIDERTAITATNSSGGAARKRLPDTSVIPRRAIFASPFFVDANANTPPDNPDTIRKRRLRGSMPLVHRFVRWSTDEKRLLMQGVMHQNQMSMMEKELAAAKQRFSTTGTLGSMTAATYREMSARINALTPDDFTLLPEDIDWQHIAKRYVRTRSAVDCMIQYTGNDDRRINQDPWTKEEDKALLKLAQIHDGHSWIEIAQTLGTNRTPMQCFQHFQRSLNSELILSKWSREEDIKLQEEVAKFGERNWQQVASRMKMRTDQQCLHRWMKSVSPAVKRGRWTPNEDLRLILAQRAYGSKHWYKIQAHVPGRTDVKCRERWTNSLDPALTNRPWTPDEDQLLLKLTAGRTRDGAVATGTAPSHTEDAAATSTSVATPAAADASLAAVDASPTAAASSSAASAAATVSIPWTKIALSFPGRTDNQLMRRWNRLVDPSALEERKEELKHHKKRTFTGRGREKSALTKEERREVMKEQEAQMQLLENAAEVMEDEDVDDTTNEAAASSSHIDSSVLHPVQQSQPHDFSLTTAPLLPAAIGLLSALDIQRLLASQQALDPITQTRILMMQAQAQAQQRMLQAHAMQQQMVHQQQLQEQAQQSLAVASHHQHQHADAQHHHFHSSDSVQQHHDEHGGSDGVDDFSHVVRLHDSPQMLPSHAMHLDTHSHLNLITDDDSHHQLFDHSSDLHHSHAPHHHQHHLQQQHAASSLPSVNEPNYLDSMHGISAASSNPPPPPPAPAATNAAVGSKRKNAQAQGTRKRTKGTQQRSQQHEYDEEQHE